DPSACWSPPKHLLVVRISEFLITTLLARTAMQPSIHRPSMTVPSWVMVRSPVVCTSGDWPATISASVQPGTPVLAAQQALASAVSEQGPEPAGGGVTGVVGAVVVVVGAFVVVVVGAAVVVVGALVVVGAAVVVVDPASCVFVRDLKLTST